MSRPVRTLGALTIACAVLMPMEGGDDNEEETLYLGPPEDAEHDPRPVGVEDLHELLVLEGGLSFQP